jgi:hypothetical protein
MLRVGVVVVWALAACQFQTSGGTTMRSGGPPPSQAQAQPPAQRSGDDDESQSSQPPAQRPPPVDDRASGAEAPPTMMTLPEVAHKSLDEAKQMLHAAGLTGQISVVYHDGQPPGNQWLCGLHPSEGQQMRVDHDVEIDFCLPSAGGEPPLVGGTVDNAKKVIADLMAKHFPASKYRIEIKTDPPSYDCEPGNVCGIEPRRWYAEPADLITIHIGGS